MRSVAVVSAFFLMSLSAFAQSKPMLLWESGAPGKKATMEAEKDTTTEKDGKPAGKPVIRLGNVTEPSFTFYPASSSSNTHAAVLVFPGGGYRILAYDLEGTEICEWLNSIGVNAVLVKYRVPQPEDLPRYQQPLQDAQRAMSIARTKAAEWKIDPAKIGVLGFSAGGHLCALLSLSADATAKPAFTILIYPAYLSERDEGATVSPELKPANAPPTFIVQAEDDKNFIHGTLLYYRALLDAHVPAEMHLYTHGGHGYGLRPTKDAVTSWPHLAENWLKSITSR